MTAERARLATLRRAAGQLVWAGFEGTTAPARFLDRITAGELGAAVLFGRNLAAAATPDGPGTDVEALRALTGSLAAAAPPDAPLLVCVDQEGGRVQRLRAPATRWPPMARLGELAVRGPAERHRANVLAHAVGRAIGLELREVGFDVDFAPVLDVHTNPANPVIGDRALATTPELVASLGLALARGLDMGRVLPCGKHFPGHGDTSQDSHLALPVVDHDRARLDAVELAPFRAALELRMFMTAHVVFPALDPGVPATMSAPILDGLLRRELGYRGVIVSDDLEMRAIADHIGVAEAAVRSLRAGCDVFLVCKTEDLQQATLEALVRAADEDATTRARLEESAARVAKLKGRSCAHRDAAAAADRVVLGAAAHRKLAAEMAEVATRDDGTRAAFDPTER